MHTSLRWTALASGALTFSCLFFSGAASSQTVFFDDFSGKTLDRTKWNIEITGQHVSNNEQQAYVDSASTIYIVHGNEAKGASKGALVIQPRYTPGFTTAEGKTFDFISGRINTREKAEFTYGEMTARIMIKGGTGCWPAWWMLGKGGWPQTGEIDIMEYVGEDDWANAALHGPGYSGETPFVNRKYFPASNEVDKWHTYGVQWKTDSLIFKYDGVPMYKITRPMVEHYGKWAMDTPEFLILNFALGGGYPVKVNGVKTPYPGLPQSTVEAIKAGKVKMLVDWVKVTKL